jgi:hypothetical protein
VLSLATGVGLPTQAGAAPTSRPTARPCTAMPSCATGPPSSAPQWTATAEAMPAQRQLER